MQLTNNNYQPLEMQKMPIQAGKTQFNYSQKITGLEHMKSPTHEIYGGGNDHRVQQNQDCPSGVGQSPVLQGHPQKHQTVRQNFSHGERKPSLLENYKHYKLLDINNKRCIIHYIFTVLAIMLTIINICCYLLTNWYFLRGLCL